MNIFVIGAHGKVGKILVNELSQKGNVQVFAGLRTKSQFNAYESISNVTPVLFDLTSQANDMAKVLKDNQIDQVVFSAGSGGNTGDDQTLVIDLDGAIKSMIATQSAGIDRYVMVSSMGSDDRKIWDNSNLHGYFIAKHYADEYLKNNTDLKYTILRPASLTDDNSDGKVELNPNDLYHRTVSRANVAKFIVAVLDNDKTTNKEYAFSDGNKSIQDAF
ncbi:SDR family oxidoreductase [Apilactobacillus xinyiensis]|uniref:SDR family oxidoreductase n=1 Tax=Apilactobacillus xinyiensis TaxID=2841032 RepID=A0ABT0I101_9LACO|nr:SDR family oxidoreductase [Apilactobacillus xinyiensis]MCK8624505.1 SDR family oxidoreductase [Apilactobacillus xinyiensis]MCL0318628.1 SDR family oxidoreductase [Apilactobacillus xinyiensis]